MLNFFPIFLGIILIWTVNGESPYRPKTTSGVYCKVPFDFKGKFYQNCTTDGSDKPWCYIKENEWDYCEVAPDFSKCEVANPTANASEIELIIQFLNNMRSKEPAIRMTKIKWNSELAMRAQFMSNLCELGNSNSKLCTSTNNMGQISYMASSSVPLDTQWLQFLIEFYNKKSSYNMETNKCSLRSCNGYKQIVNAGTTDVGCAKTSCQKDSMYIDYYFCNFYPPIYSGKPYDQGTERCDSCYKLDETKSFRCESNLCEMCDSPGAGCQGREQKIKEIASGKICDDANASFCKMNSNVCPYLDLLPANQKEMMVAQCKKTCKLC